jgi:hypothetical protein
MPFRNQYLAELTTPAVRSAEERQLLFPAACAWVGKEAGLQPSASLRFSAPLRWVGVGGKPHIRAAKRVRARVPRQARAQVQVRSPVPVD